MSKRAFSHRSSAFASADAPRKKQSLLGNFPGFTSSSAPPARTKFERGGNLPCPFHGCQRTFKARSGLGSHKNACRFKNKGKGSLHMAVGRNKHGAGKPYADMSTSELQAEAKKIAFRTKESEQSVLARMQNTLAASSVRKRCRTCTAQFASYLDRTAHEQHCDGPASADDMARTGSPVHGASKTQDSPTSHEAQV